jgi:hypothetical protein
MKIKLGNYELDVILNKFTKRRNKNEHNTSILHEWL